MAKDKYKEALDAMSDKEFRHQEEVLGKSLHLIPSQFEKVDIDIVERHPEWQPRASTDPARLFNPICLEGLATSPKVWLDDNGVYHALDGRHRWAALDKIKNERPDVWKHHEFDKGIPCQVYRSLDELQVLDLRTDEGRGQEPLANKVECFNALLPHYEAGRSDNEIQCAYWKIFADTCCSTSKRAELYDKFRTMAGTDPKGFMATIHSATRVHQQRFRYLYQCPNIIRNQWLNGELGKVNKDGSVAFKLTDTDLRELAGAVRADRAEDEASGFTKEYGVDKPGPGVSAMLKKKLSEKSEKASGEPEAKPMSKQERQAHIDEGKSRAEKIIFAAVQGNQTCQAQLGNILDQIAVFDEAEKIDGDTVREVLLAITKRKKALSESDRQNVLKIITNDTATDVDAPDPKTRVTHRKGNRKAVNK